MYFLSGFFLWYVCTALSLVQNVIHIYDKLFEEIAENKRTTCNTTIQERNYSNFLDYVSTPNLISSLNDSLKKRF